MLYVLHITVHAKYPSLTVLLHYSAFKGTAKLPVKTVKTPAPPAAALAQDGSGRPTVQGQSDSRFLRILLTQIDLLAQLARHLNEVSLQKNDPLTRPLPLIQMSRSSGIWLKPQLGTCKK